MNENYNDLMTIPGVQAHMASANRILELERRLKEEQAENARLRAVLDDVDLETAVNSMTPGGWYVLTPGNWQEFRTRADALKEAAGYGNECTALVIRVEERFGAGDEVVTPEMEDAFNGVARGVDYPATLSRGAAAHAVVEAWLRAKEEVREQMRMLCKTIRILDRRLEMAEYSRRRRATLKAQGICQNCGREDAEPGFIQCRACRLYNNQRRSGARTAPHSPYGSGRRAG